jgi:hypothetical protein
VIEVGSRERAQPAPPAVVWRSLTTPHDPSARTWLDLLGDETEPEVLESLEPEMVVWSSLWPHRPDVRIRFDLRPRGAETSLRWTLTTQGEALDRSASNHLRYRMNVLINERLRFSFGQ